MIVCVASIEAGGVGTASICEVRLVAFSKAGEKLKEEIGFWVIRFPIL